MKLGTTAWASPGEGRGAIGNGILVGLGDAAARVSAFARREPWIAIAGALIAVHFAVVAAQERGTSLIVNIPVAVLHALILVPLGVGFAWGIRWLFRALATWFHAWATRPPAPRREPLDQKTFDRTVMIAVDAFAFVFAIVLFATQA